MRILVLGHTGSERCPSGADNWSLTMKEPRPRLISQGTTTALETEIALVPFTTDTEAAVNALGFIHCGCPRVQVVLPMMGDGPQGDGLGLAEEFVRLLGQLTRPDEVVEIRSRRLVEIWRKPEIQPTESGESESFEDAILACLSGSSLFVGLDVIEYLLSRVEIHQKHGEILRGWEIRRREMGYPEHGVMERIKKQQKLHQLKVVGMSPFEEIVLTAIRAVETEGDLVIIEYLLKCVTIRSNYDLVLKELREKIFKVHEGGMAEAMFSLMKAHVDRRRPQT